MKRFSLLLVILFAACGHNGNKEGETMGQAPGDKSMKAALDTYVVEFLRRNPTVNTYLGGAGLSPTLQEADGRLRDHSPSALEVEDRWLADTQKAIELVDPATLSDNVRIDREVALAQIGFLLRQHQVRRYQERALDTYSDEPFRAIDWQLQGMSTTGQTAYGTDDEWALVVKRLGDIPRYLSAAQDQLAAGLKANNTPDFRMLRRNGIETSEADAKYFETELPHLAAQRIAAGSGHDQMVSEVKDAASRAAEAYRAFRDFIAKTFFETAAGVEVKPQFRGDRFAMGEAEYDWALKNNFHIDKTAAQLYDESWPIVQATREQMIQLAREISAKHGWDASKDGGETVRAVFDELSKDYPKSDAEMIDWYRESAFKLVEYARKTGIFDVPVEYKLEVVETPPPLQASIEGAAYYPAPPFKSSGVGRFYVSPTHNDPAALKTNNRAALADLAAHEGFPGHDWYYKVMTQYRDDISPVRWLTPGAVEDSSSMWEDSMAAEGWALYAEGLMAEPRPGEPNGFYTPEERLYQLQGQLYRDLRVRVDTGIHTGRMSYNQAVDLFSETVDFLPDACRNITTGNDAKRASCQAAENAIFRYSKWPTQAITYRLGKDEILALRQRAERLMGDRFSPKTFHLFFIRQGTIPAGYFRDELLRELAK
jgi:uncharacterized protein (DUF885 family)